MLNFMILFLENSKYPERKAAGLWLMALHFHLLGEEEWEFISVERRLGFRSENPL